MFMTRLSVHSRNGFNSSQKSMGLTLRTSNRNSFSRSKTDGYNKPLKLVEKNDLDKPVQFSKTRAATHLARHSSKPYQNKPDYQNEVISGSLAIFMIYFFILREENDIDELLYKPLNEIITDLNMPGSPPVNRGQ